MPWTCRFRTTVPHESMLGVRDVQVGDLWYERDYPVRLLSRHYLAKWKSIRPPLMIQLPIGPFCLDLAFWNPVQPNYDRDGWRVTGEAPRVTVVPLLCFSPTMGTASYCGSLRDGILSEDLTEQIKAGRLKTGKPGTPGT